MSQVASQESGLSFFKQRMKRSLAFGLFSILAVSTYSGLTHTAEKTEITVEAPKTTDKEATVMRASEVDFGFSMSVDCALSFGGAKQLHNTGLSREKYLPLEMGIKQSGGMSSIFLIGQRAPGETKESSRITDGWGVVYDKGRQQYYMYSLSTENRVPEDAADGQHEPVPFLVAKPLDAFSLDQLNQGLTYAFGDMVLNIDHQPGNPFGPLHFSLACRARGA